MRSWMSEKARTFRCLKGLSDEGGTAVTVQAMVFGNAGAFFGSGVGFTVIPIRARSASTSTCSSTHRARTWSQVVSRSRAMQLFASRCPASLPSSSASPGCSRSSFATCRISSLPSSAAALTSCRRVPATARRWPPSALRSTWWRKGSFDPATALAFGRARAAGRGGGVNGPVVAALAKMGQLPTAYAFANHFNANGSITVVALTFEETLNSARLRALWSRPG